MKICRHPGVWILAICMLGIGCGKGERGSGDASTMLVREIAALGGKTVHRDETNRMQSKWLIRRDQFGLMIDLTGVPFHDVDAEFTRWFGKPAIFAATNLDGMPQAVFKATQAGVAINYSGTKDGVSIVIIKPMNGAMFLLEAIDR